jgi:putative SOS response-associated peptidase YedK
MCNLYSLRTNQRHLLNYSGSMHDRLGNLPLLPGIFPDYSAPIIRLAQDGEREMTMARWGMPSSQKALLDAATTRADKMRAKGKDPEDFKQLLRMEPDGGVTNIRNTASKHWKRWLGVENRCLVPFNSFSEFNKAMGGNVWFAFDDSRPLAFFAGIWTKWTSVRKVKEGETTNDLFGFLTTEPNDVVSAVHSKAMPVILREGHQLDAWLSAPVEEALKLQRPLPDGTLKIVARGARKDEAA